MNQEGRSVSRGSSQAGPCENSVSLTVIIYKLNPKEIFPAQSWDIQSLVLTPGKAGLTTEGARAGVGQLKIQSISEFLGH